MSTNGQRTRSAPASGSRLPQVVPATWQVLGLLLGVLSALAMSFCRGIWMCGHQAPGSDGCVGGVWTIGIFGSSAGGQLAEPSALLAVISAITAVALGAAFLVPTRIPLVDDQVQSVAQLTVLELVYWISSLGGYLRLAGLILAMLCGFYLADSVMFSASNLVPALGLCGLALMYSLTVNLNGAAREAEALRLKPYRDGVQDSVVKVLASTDDQEIAVTAWLMEDAVGRRNPVRVSLQRTAWTVVCIIPLLTIFSVATFALEDYGRSRTNFIDGISDFWDRTGTAAVMLLYCVLLCIIQAMTCMLLIGSVAAERLAGGNKVVYTISFWVTGSMGLGLPALIGFLSEFCVGEMGWVVAAFPLSLFGFALLDVVLTRSSLDNYRGSIADEAGKGTLWRPVNRTILRSLVARYQAVTRGSGPASTSPSG